MSRQNPNIVWAGVFLDELARAGVRELVVAPGSRSTPLVLAGARDGRFRMHSIVDERSAGFFALGLGKASGVAAAVITTSGTAAANLFPAVIEASQGEVPLLVLTADRPHRLRDSDGNQAMDQLRLFGIFPRAFFEVAPPELEDSPLRHLRALAGRAVALAQGPPKGPVHLNFPFSKPLEPTPESSDLPQELEEAHPQAAQGREVGRPFVRVVAPRLDPPEEEFHRLRHLLGETPRGVIVAGPVPNPLEVGPAVLALGAATGFPVLADPLSGARFAPAHGAQVVAGYDLFLRSPSARGVLDPELILRIGASPTSSAVLEWMTDSSDAHQIVVDEGHRFKDHLASAHEYLQASPAPLLERLAAELPRRGDPLWRELWDEAGRLTRQVLDSPPAGPLLEGEILAAVVRELPAGAKLLVASSMPIRDLDAFASPGPELVRVFGNRGTSGIDGLVSTTLGIAAAGERPSGQEGEASDLGGQDASIQAPTVGVLGDLAFFHDMNGLLALKELNPWMVFVVVNNDGGGIFHSLPVKDHEPHFTRFFATPHGLDFRKVAELYGLPHQRADSLEEFRSAFQGALGMGGPAIVEVRTQREGTHIRRSAVVEAVVQAMYDLKAEDQDS